MMRNEEIFAAVRASLEGRTVKNALLIPPDFTRFHSNAGLIAGEYYRLLTERGAQVDVLPALGTSSGCLDLRLAISSSMRALISAPSPGRSSSLARRMRRLPPEKALRR